MFIDEEIIRKLERIDVLERLFKLLGTVPIEIEKAILNIGGGGNG